MSTCTTTAAPTQHLRNLLALSEVGLCPSELMEAALCELEASLGLTPTEVDERIFEETEL